MTPSPLSCDFTARKQRPHRFYPYLQEFFKSKFASVSTISIATNRYKGSLVTKLPPPPPFQQNIIYEATRQDDKLDKFYEVGYSLMENVPPIFRLCLLHFIMYMYMYMGYYIMLEQSFLQQIPNKNVFSSNPYMYSGYSIIQSQHFLCDYYK